MASSLTPRSHEQPVHHAEVAARHFGATISVTSEIQGRESSTLPQRGVMEWQTAQAPPGVTSSYESGTIPLQFGWLRLSRRLLAM